MKAIEIKTIVGTLKVMPTEENKKALNTIAVMLSNAEAAIENPDDSINVEFREHNIKTLKKLRNNIFDSLDNLGYYSHMEID